MADDQNADEDAEKELAENVGQQFDRLPATPADREVEGRASREEVVDWWHERFGVPEETFDEFTFWEKGAGKIWAFHADIDSPIRVEGLGLTFLRTRQEHWKPTTSAVQRFGREATKNAIELTPEEATKFAAGEDQDIERWEGDWGYLVAAHELAGDVEPIGVGLYVYGELRSMVPKGNQEELAVLGD
jgi:NOL1/NOP2/fmu family ribosome biogenesis protein